MSASNMSTFFDKSHAENILQKLYEQRETDPLCDVVLIAGTDEKQIPAHRCILSAASEYFKGMFSSFRESKLKEVKMPSVDGETLNSLMEYCYTGRVEIRKEVVQELLRTADMLLLNNVAKACGDFLAKRLHSSNCLGFMLLAEQYHCQSLLKRALIYLSKNFVEVYKTEEFLALNSEQLGELLSRDDLRVPNEEHIFNSLKNWIDFDRIEREKCKDELLKLVRLPLLEPEFLIDNIKPFCTSSECWQLYSEALKKHKLPKRRKLNSSESTRPRGSYEYLMGITMGSKASKKMFLHYYCPQQLKWIKWLNHFDFRSDFGIAIIEHQLYIAGGRNATGRILNTVISLNMATMTLTQVSPMDEHRVDCRAAVLNGFLYVAGGYNGDKYLSSVERWDPTDNKWSKVASFSVSCQDFGLVELNNKLYAIGNRFNELFECYDPHQNQWTSVAKTSDFPPRCEVVAANGLIYAICGNEKTKSVERYDTLTDQWTTMCSLHVWGTSYIIDHLCTAFQNKLFVYCDDRFHVYNARLNVWKADESLKALKKMNYVFSYSDELLKSEFT